MVAESVTSRIKLSRDHFWRSMSRATNVEVSALSPLIMLRRVFPPNVESGCRIGYEPTKMSRDHFKRSMSRDTNVEVSALSLQ